MDTMSEDEPTIQFSSGGPPDYVAIAAAISCMAGGRKKRRGGVGLKRGLFDTDEVVPPPFVPAAKRPNV